MVGLGCDVMTHVPRRQGAFQRRTKLKAKHLWQVPCCAVGLSVVPEAIEMVSFVTTVCNQKTFHKDAWFSFQERIFQFETSLSCLWHSVALKHKRCLVVSDKSRKFVQTVIDLSQSSSNGRVQEIDLLDRDVLPTVSPAVESRCGLGCHNWVAQVIGHKKLWMGGTAPAQSPKLKIKGTKVVFPHPNRFGYVCSKRWVMVRAVAQLSGPSDHRHLWQGGTAPVQSWKWREGKSPICNLLFHVLCGTSLLLGPNQNCADYIPVCKFQTHTA